MVYRVKLEIISTVTNFLGIVQVELSFMFARGVTSNACSVKHKGRKVFPNIYHLLTESEVITGKSQTEALMY